MYIETQRMLIRDYTMDDVNSEVIQKIMMEIGRISIYMDFLKIDVSIKNRNMV